MKHFLLIGILMITAGAHSAETAKAVMKYSVEDGKKQLYVYGWGPQKYNFVATLAWKDESIWRQKYLNYHISEAEEVYFVSPQMVPGCQIMYPINHQYFPASKKVIGTLSTYLKKNHLMFDLVGPGCSYFVSRFAKEPIKMIFKNVPLNGEEIVPELILEIDDLPVN